MLSGVVTDHTGAKVAHAQVRVLPCGQDQTLGAQAGRAIITDDTGRFALGLAPGAYDITISSPGFQPFEQKAINLQPGEDFRLKAVLTIHPHEEQVTVPSDASAATDPAANLSALVYRGEQLQLFSDDNDTFQQQLQAIAGSTDGAPPDIYVDGFSGGRFPPKNTIREVRINQDPFSAQYDRQGINRLEIFTKPGTAKFHGFFDLLGNNDSFNARNPFTGGQPPYHSVVFDANVNGPIGKRTSFFVSGSRRDLQTNTVINAVTVDANDPTLTPFVFSAAIPSPQTSNTASARLDRQFTANDSFTARYEFNGTYMTDAGLAPLALPAQAYNSSVETHTLQLGNTQIINARTVMESRFQYIRIRSGQNPVSTAPAVIVEGYFSDGGFPGQVNNDNRDKYELQEYLSWDRGAHFIRTGARYRFLRDANLETAGYNGQYIFGGYTYTTVDANGNTVTQTVNALDQYRRTLQCQAALLHPGAMACLPGSTPSQFSLTQGNPNAALLTGDLGAYIEDEWKLRPNLTLTAGFRLESQFAIPDHFDPAPRLGLSWAITRAKAKTPLLVLRPGFAIFYDRFASGNILQALRQNGISEQALFVQDPGYCAVISSSCNPAAAAAVQPTIYQIDPGLRSQYDILASVSAEHSFGRHGSVSVLYSAYHGVHQFLSRNANAPLPGTYDPTQPGSGVRPLGGTENIYQYASNGDSKGQLFSSTFSWIPSRHLFLSGFYAAQHRDTDSSGASAFVSNQYNVSADFGRSSLVAAQRLFLGLTGDLPYGFGYTTFVTAHSGLPYNITTGQDLNGDTFYNDRPSLTATGAYNLNPLPSQPVIPINAGDSPGYVSWQISLGRGIKVGPKRAAPAVSAGGSRSPSKPDRPYEFGFSVDAQNVLNHVNPGTPIGVLSSPLFGKSISLAEAPNPAANRTITLRTYFSF